MTPCRWVSIFIIIIMVVIILIIIIIIMVVITTINIIIIMIIIMVVMINCSSSSLAWHRAGNDNELFSWRHIMQFFHLKTSSKLTFESFVKFTYYIQALGALLDPLLSFFDLFSSFLHLWNHILNFDDISLRPPAKQNDDVDHHDHDHVKHDVDPHALPMIRKFTLSKPPSRRCSPSSVTQSLPRFTSCMMIENEDNHDMGYDDDHVNFFITMWIIMINWSQSLPEIIDCHCQCKRLRQCWHQCIQEPTEGLFEPFVLN